MPRHYAPATHRAECSARLRRRGPDAVPQPHAPHYADAHRSPDQYHHLHAQHATLAFLAAHVTSVPSAHRNRLQPNLSLLLEAHVRGPPRPITCTTNRMRSACVGPPSSPAPPSSAPSAPQASSLHSHRHRSTCVLGRIPNMTPTPTDVRSTGSPLPMAPSLPRRTPRPISATIDAGAPHRPNALLARTGTTTRSTTAIRSPRWSHCLSTAPSS
ncbi:hypothetical protein B0H13DRAFT_1188118 [Mycena leptocephala]|nr:hypothetical protein B0H13DRAFT_1188118 [Mycena leptocephala]